MESDKINATSKTNSRGGTQKECRELLQYRIHGLDHVGISHTSLFDNILTVTALILYTLCSNTHNLTFSVVQFYLVYFYYLALLAQNTQRYYKFT